MAKATNFPGAESALNLPTSTQSRLGRAFNNAIGSLKWTTLTAAATAAFAVPAATPALADTAVFMDGTQVAGVGTTESRLRAALPAGYDDLKIVPYPAQTWPISGSDSHTAGYSAQVGVELLDQTVPAISGRILVVGGSLGAMTIDHYMSHLPANTPGPERLSFAVFGDPFRGGILSGIAAGTNIPILDMIKPTIVDTPYDVTVIQNQYDGVGDFPDRPNLVSVINALLGLAIYHNGTMYCDAIASAQSGELAPVSVVVNPLGGTTTTYIVPRPLAITAVLKQLGVSADAVDELDRVLKPIVDAGYSRNHGSASNAPLPALAQRDPQSAPLTPKQVKGSTSATAGPAASQKRPQTRRPVSAQPEKRAGTEKRASTTKGHRPE